MKKIIAIAIILTSVCTAAQKQDTTKIVVLKDSLIKAIDVSNQFYAEQVGIYINQNLKQLTIQQAQDFMQFLQQVALQSKDFVLRELQKKKQ